MPRFGPPSLRRRQGAAFRRMCPVATAILALLAAILLPAVHSHEHAPAAQAAGESCCAHHHDCDTEFDHHHDAPSPAAPDRGHDEHSCSLCQLIAITGAGFAPLTSTPTLIVGRAVSPGALAGPQRPAALTPPRELPARGPPVA